MCKDFKLEDFLKTIKDVEEMKEIGHGILLYKDFLKTEELNLIKNEIKQVREEEWYSHEDASSDIDGLISPPIRKLELLQDKVINFVIPRYWTNGHIWVSRSAPHLKKFTTEIERSWTTADYILVYYVGDFEGGNLVLKSKNNWENLNFNIPVKENELYLLPIKNGEDWDTEEVTSGIKYASVDWIYRHDEIFIG
jgi:hypothetical protein